MADAPTSGAGAPPGAGGPSALAPGGAAPPSGGTPAPTPTPSPSAPAAPSDWRAQLPEELRAEKAFDSVPDVPTLAKRFLDAHKYAGGAIRLPPPGGRPEAWEEIYAKLGRPESPEKYEVQAPAIEGVAWDTQAQAQFLQQAHSLGLNTRQVQGVLDFYGDYLARGYEAMQRQTAATAEQTAQALKDEMGELTYERRRNTVQAFIRAEGDPELWEELERTGFGNHPQLVKLLMRVAEDWKADRISEGMKEEEVTGLPSAEAAKAEYTKIMSDTKGPYWQKSHPLHRQTRDTVRRLQEIAHPNTRGRE